MNDQVAILITTIDREPLLIETVSNVLGNLPDNATIIVGDQSRKYSKEKVELYTQLEDHGSGKGVVLPQKYDIGLSQARNELVDCAHALGFKYCLLSADSIRFTHKYDFTDQFKLFDSDSSVGIIGFHLEGSQGDWFRDLELVPGKHFLLTKPKRALADGRFQRVDIVKNFFLAKTECLLENRWDPELKMTEHEDYFYRLKQLGKWKVYYDPKLSGKHIRDRKDMAYVALRTRCYNQFKEVLQRKYNLSGWVVCNP